MIEFRPGRYVSQIWFLCGDTAEFDILGTLYRDEGESRWHLVFRFRYYDGTGRGPFDDEDRKSSHHMVSDTHDEEAALSLSSGVFRQAAERGGLDMHVVPVRTDDVTKIMDALRQQPWAHFRELEPAEKAEGT